MERDTLRLGMKDVDVGFLGRGAMVATAAVNEGAELALCPKHSKLLYNGVPVGRLSNDMQARIGELLAQGWRIQEVTVYAIVRRFRRDERDTYRDRCRRESWEVILPRITLQRGGYG